MLLRVALFCSVLLLGLDASCGRQPGEVSRLGHFRSRIEQSRKDANASEVKIVAFGDSVTMGATSIGKVDAENVYHQKLKKLLKQKYPKANFKIINSGIGGEKARDGIKRIKKDVIKHNPDLVIIGFALNDTGDGLKGVKSFKKNLAAIISKIKKNTDADIILLTANFMNTSDNSNVAQRHRKLGLAEKLSRRQNRGINEAYAKAVRNISKKYKIPVADVYREWYRLGRKGIDTNILLANGLNHPVVDAHWIPAELIFKIIEPAYKPVHTQELQARLLKEKPRK